MLVCLLLLAGDRRQEPRLYPIVIINWERRPDPGLPPSTLQPSTLSRINWSRRTNDFYIKRERGATGCQCSSCHQRRAGNCCSKLCIKQREHLVTSRPSLPYLYLSASAALLSHLRYWLLRREMEVLEGLISDGNIEWQLQILHLVSAHNLETIRK